MTVAEKSMMNPVVVSWAAFLTRSACCDKRASKLVIPMRTNVKKKKKSDNQDTTYYEQWETWQAIPPPIVVTADQKNGSGNRAVVFGCYDANSPEDEVDKGS